MSFVLSILCAVLAIVCVIVIHEMGHFIVARCCGVKVLRFSVGFGKSLFSFSDRSGTEYVLAMVPLGGYVKMLDESEMPVSPKEYDRAYNRKPVLARMAIVVAGPMANFLLAIALFMAVYLSGIHELKPIVGKVTPGSVAAVAGLQKGDEFSYIGTTKVNNWQQVIMAFIQHMGEKNTLPIRVITYNNEMLHKKINLALWQPDPLQPDPLKSLGFRPFYPTVPTIIGSIKKDTAASRSNLKPGDKIISFNGKKITSWSQLQEFIKSKPATKVDLGVIRNNQQKNISLTMGSVETSKGVSGFMGVYPQPIQVPPSLMRTVHYNPWQALVHSTMQVKKLVFFQLLIIKKILTGQVSSRVLGGPVTIFQTATRASQISFMVFISFVAFISTALGFVNLLPIPGLDGGHLLFYVIEVFRGKSLSIAWQQITIKYGLLFLIALMVFATFNDVMRLH